MLKNKHYEYNKKELSDFPVEKTFYVYGDNLLESIDIITWLYNYNCVDMKFEDVKYISLSTYVYTYKVNGEEYYFITLPYYRNGNLPPVVRNLITTIDKPDAIVYSPYKNKVIMGFETTATTMAGNATWQRNGRTIDFLDKGIPFAFLGYVSKLDQSNIESSKKPRKASNIFVLSYLNLTMKYLTPALIGFFEHSDPRQNLNSDQLIDYRKDVFNYLFSLLFNFDDEYIILEKCLSNMCNYYMNDNVPDDEFSFNVRTKITSKEFPNNLVNNIINKHHCDSLFSKNDILYEWKPKKIYKRIKELFPDTNFYQLSKNCIAGICFDTKYLITKIDRQNGTYSDYYLRNIEEPTIIIPIKLTKKGKLTDDPYNGEISAFSELYLQSFPNANVLLFLADHSSNNEYNVSSAENRKIFRSITKYSNILVDSDLNIYNNNSNYVNVVRRSRFENCKISEDSITCFFNTVLMSEGIEPSFINPPCGSWSDMRLYPSNYYYYYKRADQRADIAYYKNGVYYTGESKESYSLLKHTITNEYNKAKIIENCIKENINIDNIEYKTFCLFYGKREEAQELFKHSMFDYCVVLSETSSNIYMDIYKRENEILRK